MPAPITIGSHGAVVNLLLTRGEYFARTYTLRDKVTKVPVDLTGCSFAAQIRQPPVRTGAALAAFSFELVEPLAGRFAIELDDETTETFDFTDALWDLKFSDASGRPRWLCYGQVKVRQAVTHG